MPWGKRPVEPPIVTMCARKQRFAVEATAQKAANKMRDKGSVVYVYPCQICNGWHITGMSPEEFAKQYLHRESREIDP